jgi:hypothetical protein
MNQVTQSSAIVPDDMVVRIRLVASGMHGAPLPVGPAVERELVEHVSMRSGPSAREQVFETLRALGDEWAGESVDEPAAAKVLA